MTNFSDIKQKMKNMKKLFFFAFSICRLEINYFEL